jgi:hypothetical protein
MYPFPIVKNIFSGIDVEDNWQTQTMTKTYKLVTNRITTMKLILKLIIYFNMISKPSLYAIHNKSLHSYHDM